MTTETKLLGSTKNKITKDKIGENVPHLEITEVVLVHCNIVKNDYQQDSRVLYTFVPNKLFGNLFEIAPTNFLLLKTWTQNFKPLTYSAKKYTTDAINTASKRAIKKTVETTSDLIGNKISDKMISVSKKF